MFSFPPSASVTGTLTAGPVGGLSGFARNVTLGWVAMLRATPSKVSPASACLLISACSRRIGSLMTSCMSTPLISWGSGGSGGLVANGVLGLAAESGIVMSYSSKGGAGICAALNFSDEPAALMTGGAAPNGVL